MEPPKICELRNFKKAKKESFHSTPSINSRSVFSSDDERSHFYEDLKCSICSELLLKATTLNCSHTFCQYCIDRWLARQSFCPICRSKITYQVPTLLLDNIIEKIMLDLPTSIQKHREKLLMEREKRTLMSRSSRNVRHQSNYNYIRMRRMNGLSSYYLIPNYLNTRRNRNQVTIMYLDNDSDWEDIGDDSGYYNEQCGECGTSADIIQTYDQQS